MKSVAIIGGGITGLVAGYELQKQNVAVAIFEASDKCGGPIQTSFDNGFLVESGPNTIVDRSGDILEFVTSLGLEKHIVTPNPSAKKRYIVRNGKLISVPLSPKAFISTPLFSLSAKLRLLQEPFIGKYSGTSEESVAEFVSRRIGKEFLDYAVDPFASGVYAGDTHTLSMKYAFKDIYELEEKYGSILKGRLAKAKAAKAQQKFQMKMFSFDRGLQVLIDALVNKLKAAITYHSPIASIQQSSGKWQLTSDTGSFGGFDAVISAIPAFQLSTVKIISEDKINTYDTLNEISYPPVTSLSLGFRQSQITHALDGFGMLVPTKERMNILGTLFPSSLFDARAPEDCVLLTSYIGGAQKPELALLDDKELLSIVLNDLNSLLGVQGQPIFVRRSTFKKAIPQYTLGYGKYLMLLDDIEAEHPGLFIAGNFRTGISIPDCIASGKAICNRAIKFGNLPKA